LARLFGTDGVRGVANSELSCELAHQLGKAGAQVLVSDRRKPTIIVGRDPRASGDMLSCALMAGICSVGAHAIDVGVVTTPAIAMLVREYGADAGVMISASHNPAKDNGIKFFNGQGYKLSDALEDRIEGIIRSGESLPCPIGDDLGRIERDGQAQRRYIDLLKNKLPLDLSGLRPSVTVNFEGGFDDFFIAVRDLDLHTLSLQAEEVNAVRWVTLEELLAMVDDGSFIPYPKSFLQFLFDMRETFGFPTK